jgi:hypothetical protein
MTFGGLIRDAVNSESIPIPSKIDIVIALADKLDEINSPALKNLKYRLIVEYERFYDIIDYLVFERHYELRGEACMNEDIPEEVFEYAYEHADAYMSKLSRKLLKEAKKMADTEEDIENIFIELVKEVEI